MNERRTAAELKLQYQEDDYIPYLPDGSFDLNDSIMGAIEEILAAAKNNHDKPKLPAS